MSKEASQTAQNTQTKTQSVQKTDDFLSRFNPKNIDYDWAKNLGMNVIAALIIFIIGRWLVKLIAHVTGKAMTKSGTDETLIIFTKDLLIFVGYIFVIVAALNKLGVNTASAIAVIGAAGLAIGLAFQGALANFAAGCLIIIFRPFKVGDLIQAGGELGKVREIELFTTKMVTPDNKTVIVPNAQLTADKIINFTETDEIRLDLVFGVSYAADIDHVKKVIAQVLDSDKRILKNPAYFIGVKAHADSSVNFAVRPWVKADEYWNVFFSLQEEMKKAFDKENIEIPFPQRDVHIKND
jgi:small conductance mechanosensitive channel